MNMKMKISSLVAWRRQCTEKYARQWFFRCPRQGSWTYQDFEKSISDQKDALLQKSPRSVWKNRRIALPIHQNRFSSLIYLWSLWELESIPCLFPSVSPIPHFSYQAMIDQSPEVRPEDNEALVMFTSGTSRIIPKGVRLSAENIFHHIQHLRHHIDDCYFGQGDRTLSILPWYHCYGLLGEVFSVMDRGATFHGFSPFHASKWIPRVWQSQPTHFFVVPRLLQMICSYDHHYFSSWCSPSIRCRLWFGNHVQWVISGGASLSPDVLMYLTQKLGVRVIQGYGCTEMSPMISIPSTLSLLYYDNEDIYKNDRHSYVGELLPGVESLLSFEKQSNNPEEHKGELWVRGSHRCLGYLHETKTWKEDQWYCTGDVVQLKSLSTSSTSSTSSIFLCGRVLEQIKWGNGRFVTFTDIEQYLQKKWKRQGSLISEIFVWEQQKGQYHAWIYSPTSTFDANKKKKEDVWGTEITIHVQPQSFLSLEKGTLTLKGEPHRVRCREMVNSN